MTIWGLACAENVNWDPNDKQDLVSAVELNDDSEKNPRNARREGVGVCNITGCTDTSEVNNLQERGVIYYQ